MNRVIINLEALQHNLKKINSLVDRHQASWSVVTKALCGHEDTIRALQRMGVRAVADSRLDNLDAINRAAPGLEKWYLRLPHLSVVPDVVELADVSLNSEIEVISALSREAQRRGKIHHIMIMIELGDLREGILPGTLVKFYKNIFDLPNVQVLGLGAQVGCLSGTVPNIDQIAQLLLYRELLELKFDHRLPMISAGSSIALSMILDGQLPRGVNHFRIGEALFLGSDLYHGGTLAGLRDDIVCLEAEIAEIKEKSLVPLGESVSPTFDNTAPDPAAETPPTPGQRGYRALVTVGEIDTDVHGLTPLDPKHQIAGASSDITVVNLGDDAGGLAVGDSIRFRPNYSAFVRLMNDPYIRKELTPPLEEFSQRVTAQPGLELDVPPTLDGLQT